MAEEKEAKKASKKGADEEGAKKRPKIKLIAIGAVSLALVSGGGYFGYKKFVAKGEPEAAATVAEKAKAAKTDGLGPLFKLETFIVNLSGDSGSRYLKITMQFETAGNGLVDELNMRTPQIRDLILTLLSSRSYEDVSSTAGKFALKEEVASRVNEVLTSGEVRQVYFTEFVVQ